MSSVDDYTGLVTSQHRGQPLFMATVELLNQGFVQLQQTATEISVKFSVDDAEGDLLDKVGEWVGLGRTLRLPISGVYFSFDTTGVGFDEGVWKGPFDPSEGVASMDDGTYRLFIKAKIAANRWDGTLTGYQQLMSVIFAGTGTNVFAIDNQDMSMDIVVSGVIPSALFQAMLMDGYLPLKPVGVRIRDYYITSVYGAPVFGFDVDSDYIGGFDSGAWATAL